VVDVDNVNITIRHNAIPDTEMRSMSYTTRIHFNETFVILDRNDQFAGKTLTFNITLRAIANS
jgi:FKBP-type peptidyl-prolyl cis-trans isomerase 2